MDVVELTERERITRLEVQQEQNMQAITTLTTVVERLTRVEERQQGLTRIVYGAIGALVTVEVGGILYVLQRFAEGI